MAQTNLAFSRKNRQNAEKMTQTMSLHQRVSFIVHQRAVQIRG